MPNEQKHAEHTPGPWDWEREFQDAGYPGRHRTEDCESVLIVYGDGDNDFWRIESIDDANARLIARAPELLEQNRELLEALEALTFAYGPDGLITDCHAAWARVRAAIAKARKP